MLIQSIKIREGGTKLSLGDEEYHFKDDGKGNHVCEVEQEAHIKTLLAIKEGFVKFGDKPKKVTEQPSSWIDPNALPDDVDTWTNAHLNKWAKSKGVNFKSKEAITDFAIDNGINGIDNTNNPAEMIRVVAKAVYKP